MSEPLDRAAGTHAELIAKAQNWTHARCEHFPTRAAAFIRDLAAALEEADRQLAELVQSLAKDDPRHDITREDHP